jgi:hypothetical protein
MCCKYGSEKLAKNKTISFISPAQVTKIETTSQSQPIESNTLLLRETSLGRILMVDNLLPEKLDMT